VVVFKRPVIESAESESRRTPLQAVNDAVIQSNRRMRKFQIMCFRTFAIIFSILATIAVPAMA
jgi:hypothetical protein